MWQYILKRVLFFIPTLFLITLISFVISRNAPGDPVELMLAQKGGESGSMTERAANEEAYLQKRKELSLDLPIFYFTLTSWASSDTLYRIPKPLVQKTLARLTDECGNWEAVAQWYHAEKALESVLFSFSLAPDTTPSTTLDSLLQRRTATDSTLALQLGTPRPHILQDTLLGLRSEISSLIQTWQPDLRQMSLQKIQSATQLSEFASLQPAVQALTQAEAALSNEATQWKLYVPKFVWYGTQNQYHHWLARFLQFDLGLSYLDNRPIATKLSEALTWTLVISFCSILLTYLVSIPIGIYSAYRRNTLGDRISTTTLFILYSLPSFWIAILLLMFFSNPDYFNWFPAGGVQDILATDDCPLSYRILDWVSHLVLPVLVSTYASFAFISRQMRVGMLDALGQDYVRTARAKGLDERTVVWKHALRNSLIPIITLFASVFPALVGGSVIIETIFSIPGMGYESYKAIMTRDYPVIVAVFTLSGSLTLVGILVADVLYAVVDPRISFTKK